MLKHLVLLCFATLNFLCFSQTFENVTNDLGVFQIPIHQELMGGGVTWFDYDNDGWTDVYFTGCRVRDALFKNNGDNTFSDVTLSSGLMFTDAFNTMGAIHGDVNNDGYEDLFLTVWDEASTNEFERNILYLNNGDGTFTDISLSAGIIHESFSTSAIFLDVDLDGYLDIYVLNYLESTDFILDEEGNTVGFNHACYDNYLYLNNGDLTFTESAESYGVLSGACGLAVSSSDIDRDGDPDIQIANDFGEYITPNQLFINNYPEASFSEVGAETGFDIGLYGMGVAPGDIDNDLDQDYYITNLGSNALLQRADDELMFSEIAFAAGVDNTGTDSLLYTSWGDLFLDADNDSFLDLFIANGHIPGATFIANYQSDPDRLFMNNGDLTFTDVGEQAGVDYYGICRGSAFGDYNKDGLLDISVVGIENPFVSENQGVRIYKNTSENAGNWVSFTLEGTDSNRSAFGSSMIVYSEGDSFYRELLGGSSHLSQNESLLHFGLGTRESIDSVEVIWPGGRIQNVYDLGINSFHHIVEDFPNFILENSSPSCVIFPNPASSSEELRLTNSEGRQIEILIRDSAGNLCYRNSVYNSKNFNLSLSSGIYIATLITEGKTWHQKLFISE